MYISISGLESQRVGRERIRELMEDHDIRDCQMSTTEYVFLKWDQVMM